MNRAIDLALGACCLLVLGFLTGVYTGDVPLGVAGEWEWPRLGEPPSAARVLLGAAGVAAFGGVAAAGWRALGDPASGVRREAGWAAGLAASAVAVQVVLAVAAPGRYGLARWSSAHLLPEATGYYEVARNQAGADPWKFLAEYPSWLEAQRPGHLAVHPPGLIAGYRGLIALMDRFKPAADLLNALTPPEVENGFRTFESRRGVTIPEPDRAALFLASLITLGACAGTVAPLYLLARASLPPRTAWIAAAVWPAAPALNLFQPLSDAAYPLLSALALASAAWALNSKQGRPTLAAASGGAMGFGLLFTLAFLPVGLIVAVFVVSARSSSWSSRVGTLVWIGAGCGAVVAAAWLATGADLPTIWIWNLRRNAGFNEGARRSYLPWLLVDPIELAVAAGLPAACWTLVALAVDRRRVPRAFWSAAFVVALADLSGGNRGEVARLWMIFTPPLFTAVGVGLDRLGGGAQAVFVTIALTGVQTLGLQCLIQLVYPPG